MDNFLTTLYFEKFENVNKERRLRNNLDWEDDDAGRNANIRNDQSIAETTQTGILINKLIDKYMEAKYMEANQ